MIDIIVREEAAAWTVAREQDVLWRSTSQDEAFKAALGEASRSFERGEQVQVLFAPAPFG